MRKSMLRDNPLISWDNSWDCFVDQLSGTNIKYFTHTRLEKIDEERVLILSIFSSSKTLKYRNFISKDDYITQEYLTDGSVKWRTGSIDYILSDSYRSSRANVIFVDSKSVDLIYNFLGETDSPMASILKHQEMIRAERLNKRHQKEKDRIDERMNRVKNIPAYFEKWVNDKALLKSRYIIYKYAARKMLDGYCTHCKNEVMVERPRHNKVGLCPYCKSTVVYKASGKIKNLFDTQDVALIQKAGEELVVRYFRITKDYSNGGYKSPKLHMYEKVRDFYTSNGGFEVREFEWANFKQTGETRWCNNLGCNKVGLPVVYPSNLKRELKGTRYEYSALNLYAKLEVDFEFPVWKYLALYPEFKALEYFVKMGLTRLVSEFLYSYGYEIKRTLNLQADNIKDLFKISKDKINTLIKLNGGFKTIRILQNATEKEVCVTEKEIEIIDEYYDEDVIFKIMKYTTFHKANKYLQDQVLNYNNYNRPVAAFLSTYRDYLKDCNFLGYDLKNSYFLFPKNLEAAHQETISLIKIKKDELIDKKIGEMFSSLKEKFAWEYENYIIIPPRSHKDLIDEGNSLSHCVASSYSKEMAEGETIILFIRRKENISEPFYTIEISPQDLKIRQCRGYKNSGPEEEVENVVEKYKKKLQELRKAS